MAEVKRIIDALAIGTTVMVSEHFFSTFLSSPLTVKTLYSEKQEDIKTTMIYLYEAILISIIFGIIISYILKDYLGLASAIATCILYYVIYMDALGKINLNSFHSIFVK